MTIDSYGGSAEIVATRDEIFRVAGQLRLASEELVTNFAIESFFANPEAVIQFQLRTFSIRSKLENLYANCQQAAEDYFTTEAQIHRRFEFAFIPELARVVAATGSIFGWALDRSVTANLTQTGSSTAPASITEILDRLWYLSNLEKPTIGIEIYGTSDSRVAIVYIPGTQSLKLGENPLDMTSNIDAMAGSSKAASEKAVILAMQEAGITAADEVIFVGHSQGGMVAGNLTANTGNYLAAGLITFGAPIAQLAIKKIPVLAIEHSNDPVPNLSGKANPLTSNWVTVQRTAKQAESAAILFSHSLKSYKNTTEEVDASTQSGIKNVRGKLLQKLGSRKPGKFLEYEIQRVTGF